MKNSSDKKYHGGIEISFPLPDPNIRVLQIIKEEGLLDFTSQDSEGNVSMMENNSQMEESKGSEI